MTKLMSLRVGIMPNEYGPVLQSLHKMHGVVELEPIFDKKPNGEAKAKRQYNNGEGRQAFAVPGYVRVLQILAEAKDKLHKNDIRDQFIAEGRSGMSPNKPLHDLKKAGCLKLAGGGHMQITARGRKALEKFLTELVAEGAK